MTADRAPVSALAVELGGLARQFARGAAAVVRASVDDVHGAAAPDIGHKSSSTDLVTGVDRRSERWLIEQILAARPDDGILGEEDGERPGTSGVRWVLDPIDGTVNFVLGLPQFAVSVAAEIDGQVAAGAVCNPVSQELFSATIGGGASLEQSGRPGQRLTGPRDVALEQAVVGTGFSYDRERRARQASVVAELMPQIGDVRRMGSAALDLCAVAAGRLDGYFETALNPWDLAAGGLIAAEAGCVVTGLRGRPPSGRMVAAAGPALADRLFALLERHGADEV